MNDQMKSIINEIYDKIANVQDGRYHTFKTLDHLNKIFTLLEKYAHLLRSEKEPEAAEMQEKMLDDDYLDLFDVARCRRCGNLCPICEAKRYDEYCIDCYEKENGRNLED